MARPRSQEPGAGPGTQGIPRTVAAQIQPHAWPGQGHVHDKALQGLYRATQIGDCFCVFVSVVNYLVFIVHYLFKTAN